jgi:hypothetical protein
MTQCDKINLLKLQGQFLKFIVENHAELNILEHIESCEKCKHKILESVEKKIHLPDYGNLFDWKITDKTIPQYSEYKNHMNFVNARILWGKKTLNVLIEKAEIELEDLENRL